MESTSKREDVQDQKQTKCNCVVRAEADLRWFSRVVITHTTDGMA